MGNGRAFIFANGLRVNAPAVASMVRAGDWIIAADGGLRYARAAGLRPDLLIGDLDSLTPEEVTQAEAEGVEIRRFPVHKDETDLELALGAALQAGCREIRIVGALGGRLDMTLGNLFLLQLPGAEQADVRLEDGCEEVFLIRPGAAVIHGEAGDRVSLLPLLGPARGITTQDLYYPLLDESLYPEHTRGISNVMNGKEARVSLRKGLLVCIHSHQTKGECAD